MIHVRAAISAYILVLALGFTNTAFGQSSVEAGRIFLAGKRVAVIYPPEPKYYRIAGNASLAGLFGVFPGLIAQMSDAQIKAGRLTDVLKAEGASFNSAFGLNLSDRLKALGVDAKVVPTSWEEVEGEYKFSLDQVTDEADWFLVVHPEVVGFFANGFTEPYRPIVGMRVRLYARDKKTVSYSVMHFVGYPITRKKMRQSVASGEFANYDALLLEPKVTIEALAGGYEAASGTILEDLKLFQSPGAN